MVRNWHWGAAIFPDDKVKYMTLGADDTDELEENITEAEEVKETRDWGVQ